MFRKVFALVAVPFVLSTVACAADTSPTGDDEMNESDVTAAKKTCSTAAYNAALANYKSAVAKAKTRKAGDACDGATVWDIASQAGKAVRTCGSFSDVIKTSVYAGELRNQLKGTLAYPALTGGLDTKTWKGLDTALASGVTLYGPAPGVYGNMSKLEFGKNGKGFLHRLTVTDDGMPKWTKSDITYRVGRTRGALVEIVIDGGGIRSADGIPLLEVKTGADGAPDFALEVGDETFTAYPSECEA